MAPKGIYSKKYILFLKGDEEMKKLFTSESVTEGHPDKVCDQISDAILDTCLEQDKESRVACEVAIGKDIVLIMGEITSNAHIDYIEIAKNTISNIGYSDADSGFDVSNARILTSINNQSPDIAMGVNRKGDGNNYNLGAGDQGIIFGYACNETENKMPFAIDMANRLAFDLANLRKKGILPYLRPDGKTQVTVEYDDYGHPKRIDAIVISAQHNSLVKQNQLKNDIYSNILLLDYVKQYCDNNTKYYINPTGNFCVGGPRADSGLTGRKIIVDTYGGYSRHGGGAFSGKDYTKVDRSAAYAARYITKNIVAAGLAEKCELQLSYAIGVPEPISLHIETFGTNKVKNSVIELAITEEFDLRPYAIINTLNLKQPIYKRTAAYGHFGFNTNNLPWEKLDKIETLKKYL